MAVRSTCEIALKWRPNEENLEWAVWGPYFPYLFRFFHLNRSWWLNDDCNKLCLGKNGPEEVKLTTKVTFEVELKWRLKEESLSWAVWGLYLPDLFRFSPESISPTTLWLKQAFFWKKTDHYMRSYGQRRVGAAGCWLCCCYSFCGADFLWCWYYLALMCTCMHTYFCYLCPGPKQFRVISKYVCMT